MDCCTVGREGPATGLDIMYGGTSGPGLVWTAAMVVRCTYGLAVAVGVVDEQWKPVMMMITVSTF
jgi:hypothetical protein